MESFSAAITAGDLDIGHELHIDEGETESFAGWASAVAGVEAKVTIAESLEFCFGEFTEEGADFVEDFQVGRGAGADGFGDWGLVDCDDASDFLMALDIAIGECVFGGFVFLLEDCRNEGVEDK